MPTTRSGCGSVVATAVTSSDEVLVASTQVVGHVPRDLGEQRPLELKRLGRGLDHELALGQPGQFADRLQEGDRPVALRLRQPAAVGAALQLGRDPLGAAGKRLRVGVIQQRARARLAPQLGDPGAHRAGAGDANG